MSYATLRDKKLTYRKEDVMFSDLITFFKALPLQSLQSGSLLPDSFEGSAIPLDTISNFLYELDTTYKIIGVVLSLIIALLGCFFGFKLSKLFMSLTGFLTGAIIGYIIAAKVLQTTGTTTIICILVGAVLLALLAYWIYRAGIFILCFVLAFTAAASLLPFTGDIQFFLSTIIGFIIGSLALKYIRPVIIITSAIVCGSSAAGLLITVCDYLNIHTFSTISSAGMTFIICILGIVVQFLTTKDPAKKKRHKH